MALARPFLRHTMHVAHLTVCNFRGIRALDWSMPQGIVCLVGPGDSTKSTVLDAIDLTLNPHWSVPFDDTDFYLGDVSKEILIQVTVAEPPKAISSDQRLGRYMRGVCERGEIVDEPDDREGVVHRALTFQLRVDKELEPEWSVVNERIGNGLEPRQLRQADGAALGCVRIGPQIDRHFQWSRRSLLEQLSDGQAADRLGILNSVRQLRMRSSECVQDSGKGTIERIREAASELGIPIDNLQAKLSPNSLRHVSSLLALHSGEVPLSQFGLGTKRLISIAMQRSAHAVPTSEQTGVLLVDEIESGLEPHRIRRLLRSLRPAPPPTDAENEGPADQSAMSSGQVFMTTHSPVVLTELNASELRVVRCRNGETTILGIDDQLQTTVRKVPEALLAESVIVAEGETEMGFAGALDRHWSTDGSDFGSRGVALADAGGGSNVCPRARALSKLGYRVCVLMDSDKEQDRNSLETLIAEFSDISCVAWADQQHLEGRISMDLPESGLPDLLNLASEIKGENAVLSSLCDKLSLPRNKVVDLAGLLACAQDLQGLRRAIGDQANKDRWFKTLDGGARLGEIVAKHLNQMDDTDLAKKLANLRAWAAGP